MRASRSAALVAAYLLATLVMTRPFVNYSRFADATYAGDQQLIVWTLAWDNHALLSGRPLFDSNIFFPARESLRYNEHLFALSLFTLPWSAAGASAVLAHNIVWYLAFPLNGLAAFALLCRCTRRRSAAFTGSLVFAFSFYVMLHAHAHLHLIWIWPLPLSVLLLERWFDRPTVARLSGWALVTLVALLTSWYVAAMAVVANVLALVLLAVTPRDDASGAARARGRVWRTRGLHLAAAGMVMLLSVFPFARHYVSLRSSPGEAAVYSADVASYVIPPENTLAGRWWSANVDRRPRSTFGEQTLFAGWLALGFAGLGALALVRGRAISRRSWLFPLLAAVAFLLSLGPEPAFGRLAPFTWLAALPGGEGLRVPARFATLVMLGIAGLAAIGLDETMARAGTKGRLLPLVLAPLMLAEYFVVGFPAGRPVPQPIPAIYFTQEIRTARALASVPEYQGTERWFLGGNYLYYSTSHWRPIVNGFGRAEPDGHEAIVDSLHAFPARPEALRATGVQYIVVHAERFPDHGRDIVAAARASAGYRFVRKVGPDYLFEVVTPGAVRRAPG